MKTTIRSTPLLGFGLLLVLGPAPLTAQTEWQPAEGPLMTRWAADVNPARVLPEYPRPQLVRPRWLNLNGVWQLAVGAEDEPAPIGGALPRRILVPFPIESALSGVMEHHDRVWYRRTFVVPEDWAGRVLLHFEGVDWEAAAWVNGQEVGTHRGGFDRFSFDITDALRPGAEQELVVRVFDPTDKGDQARGKQVEEPRGIWYTPVTGIWRTVWLEPVPAAHVRELALVPDLEGKALSLTAHIAGGRPGLEIRAEAVVNGQIIGRATGAPGAELRVPVPDVRPWTPDDPFLYDLRVALVDGGREVDVVDSYFGMRSVALGTDDRGRTRMLLNGEPIFQFGPLDQGWWPDGLYTAATDEALRFDLDVTKRLGFNMTRKHVKVEPARWYHWADRIGLLVWQDMPNADNTTPESRRQFEAELHEMVRELRNHPSIVVWVPFNEGWGQYDAARIAREVTALDPSRLVIDASGWQHVGAGDIIDVHRYRGPAAVAPTAERASAVGEFGGLGHVVEGHMWAGEAWGYAGAIPTLEELEHAYRERVGAMWRLRAEPGMSAGVYTQLTDVETEANGLLTYDRAVVKLPEELFAALNRGRMPHVLPETGGFVDSVRVTLLPGTLGAELRYTLDGTEPTSQSARYEKPLLLTRSATVTARAFDRRGRPVGIASARSYTPVTPRAAGEPAAHMAPGLSYEYYESDAGGPRYRRHWPLRRQLVDAGGGEALKPLDTGVVPAPALDARRRDELFGFRFHGWLRVPRTGVYTFHVSADDAARIFVGEELVVEPFGQSPALAESSGGVALEAGLHPFAVHYFQAYGGLGLQVEWEGPGLPRQPIPPAALSHTPAAADASR